MFFVATSEINQVKHVDAVVLGVTVSPNITQWNISEKNQHSSDNASGDNFYVLFCTYYT